MMNENALASLIAQSIADSKCDGWYKDANGKEQSAPCISFYQYMQACLYDSTYGYYRSGAVRVGKEGDFYTSSAIGQALAEVLVNYIQSYAGEHDELLNLIEWGAGTGRLSAQMAAIFSNRNAEWKKNIHFILIEDHYAHAQAAREAFAATGTIPLVTSSKDAWEASWLKQTSFIVANELLDAFPVSRVQLVNGQLVELGVAFNDVRGFYEVYMPITDKRIPEWLARDGIELHEGQQTEIHIGAVDFLKRLSETMTRGRFVIIDYGHEAEEYVAEHRMLGTFMCYWKHQAHSNPYIRIGEQDITSHIPFTFIRNVAEENGFQVVSYTTQKQFLLDNGVVDMLQNHAATDPFSKEAKMNRAIRQLLLSDQMSETFKVMILEKIYVK